MNTPTELKIACEMLAESRENADTLRGYCRELISALRACDMAMGGNLPDSTIGGMARRQSQDVQARALAYLDDHSA